MNTENPPITCTKKIPQSYQSSVTDSILITKLLKGKKKRPLDFSYGRTQCCTLLKNKQNLKPFSTMLLSNQT